MGALITVGVYCTSGSISYLTPLSTSSLPCRTPLFSSGWISCYQEVSWFNTCSLLGLDSDPRLFLSFSVHVQLHDYVGYRLPHDRCLCLTENAPHRLNARKPTVEKDTSSFNVSGAFNHFRSGQTSTWAVQTERNLTTTMDTEIISDQVSDGDEGYRNFTSNLESFLGRDPSGDLETLSWSHKVSTSFP